MSASLIRQYLPPRQQVNGINKHFKQKQKEARKNKEKIKNQRSIRSKAFIEFKTSAIHGECYLSSFSAFSSFESKHHPGLLFSTVINPSQFPSERIVFSAIQKHFCVSRKIDIHLVGFLGLLMGLEAEQRPGEY